MNYFSLPISIYFQQNSNFFFENSLIFLYFINSAQWIFFVSLLYFEFRRKLSQTWRGLRGFWLFNGLEHIGKIIFIFNSLESDQSTSLKYMVFIQACLSLVLLYIAFFGSIDYELKVSDKKDKDVSDNNNIVRDSSMSNHTNSLMNKLDSKSYLKKKHHISTKIS
jgi:hypothetical protein